MKYFYSTLTLLTITGCLEKEDTTQPDSSLYCEQNPSLNLLSEDGDCDGIITTDDCDDNDASNTAEVGDCDMDGFSEEVDCDDNDPSSTNISVDQDCDGIITTDDCDDTDPSSTVIADDADCDGIVTSEDCDDTDSNNILNTPNCCVDFLLIQKNTDNDGDGNLGSGDIVTEYTYDSSGNLEVMTIDNDADNSINYSYTYTYDSNNQMTERLSSDGWLETTTYYTYDASGNLTLEENDDLSDQSIDTTITYNYDSSSNLVSQIYRIYGNTYDRYDWTYNSSNQQTGEAYEVDDSGWGTLEQQYHKVWSYTSSGLLEEYRYENFYNGYNDGNGTYSAYTYDSANYLDTEERGSWDWCCSINIAYTASSELEYQHDGAGNIISISADNNLDGLGDTLTSYTYDSTGNLLSENFKDMPNSSNNYIYYWSYDEAGNLTLYEEDSGANGTIDHSIEYIYQCQ